MNCPRCRKAVPEESVFCPYCGASVTKAPKAAEPSPAPRRVKVRSVVKWTVLGLVLLAILWRTVACIHEQMVSEEDLDSMVRSIQGGAEEIIELMDPIMADVRDGEPMDLSDIDMRMTASSITRAYIYKASNINALMGRQGWKSEKYQEYEDLYDAYKALYNFMDEFFSGDPAYENMYSRRLTEEMGLSFIYTAEDAEALRTRYESLVQAYRKCLKRIP